LWTGKTETLFYWLTAIVVHNTQTEKAMMIGGDSLGAM
jgi:hypothetical protein